MISYDTFDEEIQIIQEKLDPIPAEEKINKEMNVSGFEDLPTLCISRIRKN